MVLYSGAASVGILKPVVGASATLQPVQTVKPSTPPAPLKPVVKALPVTAVYYPPTPPTPLSTEQRALPRPDSVPSLSWKTVGLFAAAGLGLYLIFHG